MIFPVAKRELLAQALDRTGCNRLLQLAGTWNGLLVLNYHRIGEPAGSLLDWELWSASQEDFDRQVRYLARHFDPIGLDDLNDVLHRRNGRSHGRSRFVMISFDDGYRDNYELAFPILQSCGVPATIFLTTGFLDRRQIAWWDEIAWMIRTSERNRIDANVWTIRPIEFDEPNRSESIQTLLSIFKKLDGHETHAYLEFLAEATGSGRCPTELADEMWMTWDMVRDMRRKGMCFGGHTVNHPVLSSLSLEEQDAEICECRLRIECELSEDITALSYPVGAADSFNDVTRHCLTKHGFRWAFSYHGGYTRLDRYDPLNIPRFAVETDVSMSAFRSVASVPQLFA